MMGICKSKITKNNKINDIIDQIIDQKKILNTNDILILTSPLYKNNKIILPKNSILIKYSGHTFGVINNKTTYVVNLILFNKEKKLWMIDNKWRSINKNMVTTII